MRKKVFILTFLMVILSGYTMAQVKLLNPSPNLNLKESNGKIFLLVGEKIPDNFISQGNGIRKIKVAEWLTQKK